MTPYRIHPEKSSYLELTENDSVVWQTIFFLFLLGEPLKLPLQNCIPSLYHHNPWHLEKFLAIFDGFLYIKRGTIQRRTHWWILRAATPEYSFGSIWKNGYITLLYFLVFHCKVIENLSVLGLKEGSMVKYCLPPEGTPKRGGLNLTVYSESILNIGSISFC